MSKKSDVTFFIENVFETYGINMRSFFFTYGNNEKIELFEKRTIDKETLSDLSEFLGLTEQEILNTDLSAALKYLNKFKFLSCYNKYKTALLLKSRYKEDVSDAELFIRRIFGTEDRLEKKIDFDDMKRRIKTHLKEVDKKIPGTYHKNAVIENLKIRNNVSFSFPECPQMIQGLFDIIDHFEKLFFAALNENLTEEEINEYNFLVTALKVTDCFFSDNIPYYRNVCKLREYFLAKNYPSIFSYVKFDIIRNFTPWMCYEFFDDMELVKKYVYCFSDSKKSIRNFYLGSSKFCCMFHWSDDEPILVSYDDELPVGSIEPYTIEKTTTVYIPKNKDEAEQNTEYLNNLRKVSSSVAKGGFPMQKNSPRPWQDYMNRCVAWVEVRQS